MLKDQAPILFEGFAYLLLFKSSKLADRLKMVRMHNIEHEYYERLEWVERNFFKKYFFSKEAQRLKEFERVLEAAQVILAISPSDENYLKQRFKNVAYVPAFHPNHEVTGLEERDVSHCITVN